MTDEHLFKIIAGALVLSLGFYIVKDIYHDATHHCIPKNQRVELDCASPAKLRFEFQDLNGNGTNEFLLNYEGTRYLFKTNELGEPLLQRYQLSPLERPNL